MRDKNWTIEYELLKNFKKGQLVRLNPHGLFDFPYKKDQLGIVIKIQFEPQHYRGRTGVWVWLQKDECKVVIDAWDLDVIGQEDAEEIS